MIGYTLQELVLVLPHRHRIKLRCCTDNLDQLLQRGLRRNRRREQLDGGISRVVVCSNHAQIERGKIHVVLDGDALGLFQIRESLLNRLRQVVAQVTMADTLKIVIIRVLGQPPVVKCPSEVVDSILLCLYRFGHYLRVQVIVQVVI